MRLEIFRRRVGFVSPLLVSGLAAAQPCLIPQDQIVSGGPGKDGTPALTAPRVVAAAEGDGFLEDEVSSWGSCRTGRRAPFPMRSCGGTRSWTTLAALVHSIHW